MGGGEGGERDPLLPNPTSLKISSFMLATFLVLSSIINSGMHRKPATHPVYGAVVKLNWILNWILSRMPV
jgi:hypothetical protein